MYQARIWPFRETKYKSIKVILRKNKLSSEYGSIILLKAFNNGSWPGSLAAIRKQLVIEVLILPNTTVN